MKMVQSKQLNKNNSIREIPIGVKLISIYYWIMAILIIIIGLVSMYFGLFLLFPLIIVGIFLIASSVLLIFIAINLWKGKEWAMIAAIIFAIIGLGDIFRLFKPLNVWVFIINLTFFIVSVLIIWYLIFNKGAKEFFNKSS